MKHKSRSDRQIAVHMSQELYEKIWELANERQVSMGTFIRQAVVNQIELNRLSKAYMTKNAEVDLEK